MCFSASASFAAGTTLSVIGVATLKNVKSKSELPFALMPLLFGVQQLSEGAIWLTFGHDALALRQVMTYVFIGFARVLWPVYVPLAIGMLEPVRWRKRAIFAFEAAGVVVSGYLLWGMMTAPVIAEVAGMHIVYASRQFDAMSTTALYVAATCACGLFSSYPFVRMFGALTFGSFIAANMVATNALVSVWCFFAALLSFLIYLHLKLPRAERRHTLVAAVELP